jgi:DNA/RNA endonuclease G (NUC1)
MHQDTREKANFCNYAVPVRDVELRTHLEFFVTLSPQLQDEIETQAGKLWSRLGCRVVRTGDTVAVQRAN